VVHGDVGLADGAALVSAVSRDNAVRKAAYGLDQPMDMVNRGIRVRKKASALVGASMARAIWDRVEALDTDSDLTGFTKELA